LFIPPRNPQQQFCSRRLCQNARKSNWRRAKHKNDPDYRENQNHACKRWRKKNPDYWKQYRSTHPLYTDNNRQQQKQRKQMLGKKSLGGSETSPFANGTPQFANSDAYPSKNPVKAGTYQLVPVPCPGFANSDALIVEISVITNGYQ
jgi:hypothetical protein